LAVFLTVLKILGITVACIIGLVILFVALLMLIPFRYVVDVDYRQKKLKLDATVRWDAKAVRVWYSQLEDGTHDGEALLFGIPVMRLNEDSDWMDQQIAKAKAWVKGIYCGIKEAPEGPVERLERIKTELTGPKWIKISRKLFERIKVIVLEVFPKEGKGTVVYGLVDPYITGKILETLAFFYPLYGNVFDICPSFQEKVFTMELKISNKFVAGKIIFNAVHLLFGKDTKDLYREFMRLTHNER